MSLDNYRSLPPRLKVLVAVAVLLDGREAAGYLGNDSDFGAALSRAATDLGEKIPELRMPLVGTLLRAALQELKGAPKEDGG